MGALAAVGRGSHSEPRLIVLRYDPPQPARPDLLLGLVGKAITFDSGGISIKQAAHMEDMKGDMAGGAGTLHGIGAVAALGLPVRAIAVLAAAENLPGGDAFRPGDILRAANGKTIEIINTDAEGRLVLADALWYARREGATHVLDLATLTGAMELALGDLYAGVFANDDDWRDRVVAAGRRSGDLVWPFPLHPRYRRYVDSAYADMKNGSLLRQGSPALAAEFLHEFAGDGPWAHVDMAGPGFLERSRGDYFRVPGGTGYGVRLIAELATGLVVNYELGEEQELVRRDGPRVRGDARRARRGGARPRKPVPVRARGRAGRARADGDAVPGGVRRRRRGHRLLRDRDRGADARRFVRRDHRRRAHLARDDADLPVRHRGAEAGMAAAAHVGTGARRVRADRARRRLRRRRDAHPRRAPRQQLDRQRLEELHHQLGHRHHRVRDRHRAHRRGRGVDDHRPERDSRLRAVAAAEEARLARVGHAAADVRGLRRPGAEPARRARPRVPPVHGDPRRRPHLGRRDGRRARAGRVRPRVRATRRSGSSSGGRSPSSRRCSSRSPTWRPRSRRAASSSTAPPG